MNWTITKIASVVLSAVGSGLALSTIGQSPVIGYIIAGIILGPSGFKFITDQETIGLFAEMGILFLLFAIGLSLSFEKIKNIWRTSLASTIISSVLIYALMLMIGRFLNFSNGVILLMTFCVTLSSTAVTVKSLKFLKERDDSIEENTFGVLITQDLAAMLMVIVINFMGPISLLGHSLIYRISAVCIFISALVFYFRKYHVHIHRITNFISRHEDMLTLMIFGICLGCAVLSEVAGLSAPFGAFLAGLILGNSNMKDKIKRIASPIEEILLVTFFLSIGLLQDLRFMMDNFVAIFSALIFVTFGKTIINIFVFRICRFPLKESFVISVLLAHLGEFSFMLVNEARKIGLITNYGIKFLVSLTALSLFLSPLWLIFAERCRTLTRIVDISSSWEFFRLIGGNEIGKFYSSVSFILRLLRNGISAFVTKFKEAVKKAKTTND